MFYENKNLALNFLLSSKNFKNAHCIEFYTLGMTGLLLLELFKFIYGTQGKTYLELSKKLIQSEHCKRYTYKDLLNF